MVWIVCRSSTICSLLSSRCQHYIGFQSSETIWCSVSISIRGGPTRLIRGEPMSLGEIFTRTQSHDPEHIMNFLAHTPLKYFALVFITVWSSLGLLAPYAWGLSWFNKSAFCTIINNWHSPHLCNTACFWDCLKASQDNTGSAQCTFLMWSWSNPQHVLWESWKAASLLIRYAEEPIVEETTLLPGGATTVTKDLAEPSQGDAQTNITEVRQSILGHGGAFWLSCTFAGSTIFTEALMLWRCRTLRKRNPLFEGSLKSLHVPLGATRILQGLRVASCMTRYC